MQANSPMSGKAYDLRSGILVPLGSQLNFPYHKTASCVWGIWILRPRLLNVVSMPPLRRLVETILRTDAVGASITKIVC